MVTGYWEPIPIHRAELIVGLDLGEAADYTGLIQVERTKSDPDGLASYDVQAIERIPLGVRYPVIVAHAVDVIKALAEERPRPELTLVVDYTGVGRPVADMLLDVDFDALGCTLVLITITGGDTVTRGAGSNEYRVPKRDLASTIQVLLQSNRLRFGEGLPLVNELTKELKGFRVKISLSGHDSYAAGEDWRSAPHDDLVLSLALGTWYGETISGGGWDAMPYGANEFASFLRAAGVG